MVRRRLTLEQVATALIGDAKTVADRYILERGDQMSSTQDVRDGIEYAFILAGLRTNPAYFSFDHAVYEPKYVVGLAMKMRFNISDEDFATGILGG